MSATAVRVLFCISAAVLGAALADPLVEFASNLGLFGAGTFTDHSTLDVLPTLGIAALFVVLQSLLRAQSSLRTHRGRQLTRLLRVADDTMNPRATLRLLPAVFALQLLVLFGMETIEQFVVAGHGLGALVWLGGPVLVSLVCHAFFCLVAVSVVARTIHALAHAVVRIVHVLRAIATLSIQGLSPLLRALDEAALRHKLAPSVARIGERAPPFSVR